MRRDVIWATGVDAYGRTNNYMSYGNEASAWFFSGCVTKEAKLTVQAQAETVYSGACVFVEITAGKDWA